MRDYIEIGSTPHDEDCAQVGTEDYARRAKRECNLFMQQIAKHYPEPDNGYLSVKSFSHDFGNYYEVVANFDDDDAESVEWAYDIESDNKGVLSTWEAEFHPINLVLQGEVK